MQPYNFFITLPNGTAPTSEVELLIQQPASVSPVKVKNFSLRQAEGTIIDRWLPNYNAGDEPKTVTLPVDSSWTDQTGKTWVGGSSFTIPPWSCSIMQSKPQDTIALAKASVLPVQKSECGVVKDDQKSLNYIGDIPDYATGNKIFFNYKITINLR